MCVCAHVIIKLFIPTTLQRYKNGKVEEETGRGTDMINTSTHTDVTFLPLKITIVKK